MKANKIIIGATVLAVVAMIAGGCSSMNKTAKGALIGTGSGAAVGAGVGALIGGGKGAGIGAAIGAAVGAGTGAVIGRHMDKQAAKLAEELDGTATVETVEDVNGLTAIKVTFDGGILFDTNKSDLNANSKVALSKFVDALKESPDTDISIFGHTDNTGTLEVNNRVSLQRAQSVEAYLRSLGLSQSRIITVEGKAYLEPVADNNTAVGRAQNRRVEIYISANQNMVNKADKGNI